MDTVEMKQQILQQMIQQALQDYPMESCGMLAGSSGVIHHIHPIRNQLQSAVRYFIDPAELFSYFKLIRSLHLDLLGIYHSHPSTEAFPSFSDIERAFYPSSDYFIISLQELARPVVRAFRISGGSVAEKEIKLVE
jgi:proteasome lid subunit RPN8/RPN11